MKPRVCATRLLRGEHWAKPIPPEPDCLVTNVDPALGQETSTLRSDSGTSERAARHLKLPDLEPDEN